jgi:hypothetical protein
MVSHLPPHSSHQKRQPKSPALMSRQRGMLVMSFKAKLGGMNFTGRPVSLE